MRPIKLPYDLKIKTPIGDQSLIANWVNRNCEIWVGECKLLIDLISLTIKRYDVILGVNFEDEILLGSSLLSIGLFNYLFIRFL